MATSHLMTSRYISHFGLNSLILILQSLGEIFHTLPLHGNDPKSQACSDGFSNILQFINILNILD